MDRLSYRDAVGHARLTLFGKQMYCSTQATAECFAKLEESLAAYKDTGLEPEEIAELTKSLLVGMNKRNRAMELLQAESEGRLIVLPCKVGDTVYETDGVRIYESTIRKIVYDTDHVAFDDDAIGHSVFLTREEAEAALGGDHEDRSD